MVVHKTPSRTLHAAGALISSRGRGWPARVRSRSGFVHGRAGTADSGRCARGGIRARVRQSARLLLPELAPGCVPARPACRARSSEARKRQLPLGGRRWRSTRRATAARSRGAAGAARRASEVRAPLRAKRAGGSMGDGTGRRTGRRTGSGTGCNPTAIARAIRKVGEGRRGGEADDSEGERGVREPAPLRRFLLLVPRGARYTVRGTGAAQRSPALRHWIEPNCEVCVL